ncbi:MAG: DUF368 domain-containing protein [Candidatus Izemoplasmatales bacterium]|jgi:putative membrane protein
MTFLILILKGFLIGLAFIIPGVSGGTIAVYLGVYDKLLNAIGNIFKEFRKSMKLLIPIFLGAVISVVGLAWLLGFLIDKNSLVVLMLFIGLILGGIPALLDKISGKGKTKAAFITFVIAFVLVLTLVILDKFLSPTSRADFTISAGSFFLIFLLGAIASMTMIVPGISGSALLMMLGFYTVIVTNVIGNILDFSVVGYNLFVLIPFALGIGAGIILFSKLLGHLLGKFPVESYGAILGFVMASAIGIFFEIRDPATGLTHSEQLPVVDNFVGFIQANPWSMVWGFLVLGAGFFISFRFLPRADNKRK